MSLHKSNLVGGIILSKGDEFAEKSVFLLLLFNDQLQKSETLSLNYERASNMYLERFPLNVENTLNVFTILQ